MTSRAHIDDTRGVSHLERRLHGPADGIPYFDEELQVPQSHPHQIMVTEMAAVLAELAREAGLTFLSDEPIWYFHPETDEQRTFYGDLVLAGATDRRRVTAADLLLVLEVVSTNDTRKERKDVVFQRALNEYNEVAEFGLLFPDLDDARALSWLRYVDGEYRAHSVAPGGSVMSESVPGLELRVLPRDRWASGHKIDVFYRGERRLRLAEERARAAEERARAERLAERLRALGVDPDTI